ncbi:MAG: hypothetical protein NUV56_00280 [Candidatus Uhrbacteria bacterium]|nr:hypothetical protein [Candidatus Uhrbacteria bacterium]
MPVDQRFLDDTEEHFLRCCKNGMFAMNVDIWFDFVMETLVPGARERVVRAARLVAHPAAEQLPLLKAKMKENSGIFYAINSRHDLARLDVEQFYELTRLSLAAT